MRSLYVAGLLYAGFSAFVLLNPAHPPQGSLHSQPPPRATGQAREWFTANKAYCNAVEVETIHRRSPPPSGLDGTGYSAACYALSGRVDRARTLIRLLPGDRQYRAAGIVFNVAHPVADLGDDRSAGPIMELVVEFWPNHYQALYHAGMSNDALGNYEQARVYLESFLEYYRFDDGWTRNARHALRRHQR